MTPPLPPFPSPTLTLPVTPFDAWVKCKMQQETRSNDAFFDLTNGSPFVICIRQTLSGFYRAARPPAWWGRRMGEGGSGTNTRGDLEGCGRTEEGRKGEGRKRITAATISGYLLWHLQSLPRTTIT